MKHIARSVCTLLLGLSAALPALAQPYGQDPGFWHPGWGWGHMLFGGLMMIAFWGGIIVLVVLLVRWLGSSGTPDHPRRPTPLEILQERYARGEIDRQAYEERKRDLHG